MEGKGVACPGDGKQADVRGIVEDGSQDLHMLRRGKVGIPILESGEELRS